MRMLKNDLNLEVTRGDTFSFGIEIDDLGQELEAAYFTCKNNYDDQNYLFQKILNNGIMLDKIEGNNYFYKIRLAPQDTINLEAGLYYYDFQIEINGDVFTILKGALTLTFDVTERSGTPMAGTIKVDWGNIEGDIGNQTDLMDELAGKANATHTHAISDITSGILSLANGGTGATNVSDAWANMQIYTDVEQLELSYPCTAVEICNAMPNKSIFITNIEDKQLTVTDVPVSWGMLNIIKISNSRKELEFARAMNTDCTRYIGGYSSGDTTVTWKNIPYGIISINQGGTGANTKTSARNALGAASSDDVGDVSNLSTSSKTIVGAINELYQAIQSL